MIPLMRPTLVVTTEQAGVDKYSLELARRLPVRCIETGRYLSLWQSLALALRIAREPGLVHLPNQNFARYALLRRGPYIVTVHDVIRFRYGFDPETPLERLMLRLDVIGIRRASHLIATSRHTRKDLVEYLGVPAGKVSVVYNGADHDIFRPRADLPRNGRFVLYVGSERPRKNLRRLFEAFSRLKREFPDLKLVKVGPVGRSGAYRQETLRHLHELGITGDVHFVDYLPEQELARYYATAALLAYPSLYEGFGLPPLEAMSSGCPVVSSSSSSLPEVVGEAGILVPPEDTEAWVESMRRVLTEPGLREELVSRGIEQARRFSWDRCAEETLAVYRRVGATLVGDDGCTS